MLNSVLNKQYKSKYGVTTQMLHSYTTIIDEKEIIAPIPDVMNKLIEEEYGNVEF